MKRLHVAAGVISNAAGQVLVTKRPDRSHQGGLWEFPGGKLEHGESVEQALARELDEELGIQVRASRPLIRLAHDYVDRHVLLDIQRILDYRGVPQGREGQPLDWLRPDAMHPARFPAADRPVISALRLPDRYLITGADLAHSPAAFTQQLEQALAATKVRIVQLRAPGLSEHAYANLAERCHGICQTVGAKLILNCAPSLATSLPCDGLHLTQRRLNDLHARPAQKQLLIGASCHDAESLEQAANLELDYALLSPVFPTATHPGVEPLGWSGFEHLVEAAHLPVYALGGVHEGMLETAFQHGAQGVAGISAFWTPTSRP